MVRFWRLWSVLAFLLVLRAGFRLSGLDSQFSAHFPVASPMKVLSTCLSHTTSALRVGRERLSSPATSHQATSNS
jgi:hypothetical protein